MSEESKITKSWYLASWPPLAWAETVIKLAALLVGMQAGWKAMLDGRMIELEGIRSLQVLVIGLAALGIFSAIYERIRYREIISMIFVVVNNLGHWGMFITVLSPTMVESQLGWFAGGMLLGDLVKLLFFKVNDFSIEHVSKKMLYGLVWMYVALYLVLLISIVAG